MYVHSEILELRLDSALLTRPEGLEIQPGQYLLAAQPTDPLPCALFPSGWGKTWLAIAAPIPDSWRVGQRIALRIPLGRGFSLPTPARRIAAASLGNSPARLLPLISLALAQGAEVCLYTSSLPGELPEAVEVLPPNLLPQAWDWADFLALDCPLELREKLNSILPTPLPYRLPCPAQIIVYTQMPCGAAAECGICAVETRHGWQHACKDGPVFDLQDLL